MTRSENMRRIRSQDTGPEIAVRKALRQLGFSGYRLHRNDLPGRPDIAWIGRKKGIFVHGCFWHGHACNEGIRKPKSNQGYWLPKIERNRQRGAQHIQALSAAGWDVLVIWDCEMQDFERLSKTLGQFMTSRPA